MLRSMALFAIFLCLGTACYGAEGKIAVNGYWGSKPLNYALAVKRLHFHILMPQGWRPIDCTFYPQWILHNNRFPRVPARQAVAIENMADPSFLVIEAPYISGISPHNNKQVMYWIIANGFFTKDFNKPGVTLLQVNRGGMSYDVVTSIVNRSRMTQFELSLP